MSTESGISLPITEQENPRSQNLSSQSSREIVALMNAEDATVAAAVQLVLDDVAKAVDETAARLSAGGRLFYVRPRLAYRPSWSRQLLLVVTTRVIARSKPPRTTGTQVGLIYSNGI
jgi:hypothetical protein